MAIRAYDLAFAHRHVRRAEHLRAPIFVALEAGVRLERSLQLVLARHDLHDRVAVGAHQAAFFVRAAVPIGAVTAFMAAETNTVVLFRRARPIFRAERDDPAHTAPAAGLHVRRSRTVAVLASELAFFRLADPTHERLLEFRSLARMAGQANLIADGVGFDRSGWVFTSRDWAFVRLGSGRRLRRRPL